MVSTDECLVPHALHAFECDNFGVVLTLCILTVGRPGHDCLARALPERRYGARQGGKHVPACGRFGSALRHGQGTIDTYAPIAQLSFAVAYSIL